MENILSKVLVSVFTLASLLMLIGSIIQYLEVGSLENWYWVSRISIFISFVLFTAFSGASYAVFKSTK